MNGSSKKEKCKWLLLRFAHLQTSKYKQIAFDYIIALSYQKPHDVISTVTIAYYLKVNNQNIHHCTVSKNNNNNIIITIKGERVIYIELRK